MEVKIKQGTEMLDDTIEMVDGRGINKLIKQIKP